MSGVCHRVKLIYEQLNHIQEEIGPTRQDVLWQTQLTLHITLYSLTGPRNGAAEDIGAQLL